MTETADRAERPVAFETIDLAATDGVLIDLDDTLYRYAPAHAAALRGAFAAFGRDEPFERFAADYRTARDQVTARLRPQGACRSRLLGFQAMLEARGERAAYVLARELAAVYWSTFIGAMTVDAGALAFLERCAARSLPVCVVSDMTAETQVDKITALGLNGLVSFLVTSEEVGAEKPDPKMFLAGLAKIKVDARRAVMIGDDFDKDFVGSCRLGIRGILVSL